MKLVAVLAGESPASANCPVATVVISGDGAGDQTVGSPEVKVLVGWMQVRSAPTGGRANQQVVAQANRSEAPKISPSRESECEDYGNAETVYPESKASVCGEGTGYRQPQSSPWSQRTTC